MSNQLADGTMYDVIIPCLIYYHWIDVFHFRMHKNAYANEIVRRKWARLFLEFYLDCNYLLSAIWANNMNDAT